MLRSVTALVVLLSAVPVFAAESSPPDIPAWISILPPLLAILFALAFRQVIPALLCGLWMGAWAVHELSLEGIWVGLFDVFQVHVLAALADSDHGAIILFTLMIGGMVGIVSASGGMHGVVEHITAWANTRKRAQTGTAMLGLAVFFDDYANTMVVGNTMRSVTDRLGISREKLAYIVDSTAAPVACLAFVTTWIGFEVGLIKDAIKPIPELTMQPYELFLASIPYSFYPVLALVFVFMITLSGRDFGPMAKAEQLADENHDPGVDDAPHQQFDADLAAITPKKGSPHRAINALLPVFVLVGGVVTGLFVTGEGDTLREIIGSADSYKALMWASFSGALVAAVLSLSQGILNLDETVQAWFSGVKSMLFAMIILVLAWALAGVTELLGTADFLVGLLGSWLPAALLPALVFVLSAATAFATGSSWGAMGILMPLVLPLTWAVIGGTGGDFGILYSSLSCVLAGAVWGDHCSPISDTTILSSTASGCEHIEHVRTQLPYAMFVGITGILLGTLPVGFGMHWAVGYLLGVSVLAAGLLAVGRKLPTSGGA